MFNVFVQVTLQDNGTYTLTVDGGRAFHKQPLSIVFDIIVSNSASLQNTASSSESLTIAAFILSLVAIKVLITVAICYYCKARNKQRNTNIVGKFIMRHLFYLHVPCPVHVVSRAHLFSAS